MIVVDFTKAFDKVSHERLLYKLDFHGIRGHGGATQKWIDSCLSEHSKKVALLSQASDPVPFYLVSHIRVQFLIFIKINDLPDNICSPITDDCVLYRNIVSTLDCRILQDDLNSLAQWEMDWQMRFNISICYLMKATRLHPSNQI